MGNVGGVDGSQIWRLVDWENGGSGDRENWKTKYHATEGSKITGEANRITATKGSRLTMSPASKITSSQST